jgi:hypothetical protein
MAFGFWTCRENLPCIYQRGPTRSERSNSLPNGLQQGAPEAQSPESRADLHLGKKRFDLRELVDDRRRRQRRDETATVALRQ